MSENFTDENSLNVPLNNTIASVNEVECNVEQPMDQSESMDTADKQTVNHVQDVCGFCSIIIESSNKVNCEKCSNFFHASEKCISLPMEVIDFLLQYKNSGLFYKCVNCRMQIKKEFAPLIDASATGSESNTSEINDKQCGFDTLEVICKEDDRKNGTEILHNKGNGQNVDPSKLLCDENVENRIASKVSAIKVKKNRKRRTVTNLKVIRPRRILPKLLPGILIKTCAIPENTRVNSNLSSNVSLPQKTQRHTKITSANETKVLKCDFCKYSTSKKKLLTQHAKIHLKPQSSSPVKCDVCGRTFKYNITLEKHKTIHTGEKLLKCNLCVRTFLSQGSLEKHKILHTREKSFKCEICSSAYITKARLRKHVEITHENIRFNCNYCDSSFRNKSTLRAHIRHHTGEKLNCHLCERSFYSSIHLQTHLLDHTGERPYKCKVCEYSAKDLGTLSKHSKIHSDIKSFKCSYCDYGCRVKGELIIHIRTHTGDKPFKCNLCDYKAVSKYNLKRHIRCAHEFVKRFKCQYCNYSNHEKNHLEGHMRIHTGEKPFSCHLCAYSAREKRHLTIHLRTHTGEKPYTCNLCDYAAAQVGSLTLHRKTKHASQYESTNTQE